MSQPRLTASTDSLPQLIVAPLLRVQTIGIVTGLVATMVFDKLLNPPEYLATGEQGLQLLRCDRHDCAAPPPGSHRWCCVPASGLNYLVHPHRPPPARPPLTAESPLLQDIFTISMACAIGCNVGGLLVCSLFALLLNSSPKGTARGFVRRFGPLLWIPLVNLVGGILALMVSVGAVMKVRYPSLFLPLVGWAGASLLVIFVMVTWQYVTIHCRKALLKDKDYAAYVQEHEDADNAEDTRVQRLLALRRRTLADDDACDAVDVVDRVEYGGDKVVGVRGAGANGAKGTASGAGSTSIGTGAGSPRKVTFSGPPLNAVELPAAADLSPSAMQSGSFVSNAPASPSQAPTATTTPPAGGLGVAAGSGYRHRDGDASCVIPIVPTGAFSIVRDTFLPRHRLGQDVPSSAATRSQLDPGRRAPQSSQQLGPADGRGGRTTNLGGRFDQTRGNTTVSADAYLPGQPMP